MIVLGVLGAGALGAVVRALVTNLEAEFNRRMSGTAAVNIIGSFLLGLLASSEASTNTLAILGVGGLGAMTTFSTYISQIECIYREAKTSDAILYCVGSLVLGIAAAYLGWVL